MDKNSEKELNDWTRQGLINPDSLIKTNAITFQELQNLHKDN